MKRQMKQWQALLSRQKVVSQYCEEALDFKDVQFENLMQVSIESERLRKKFSESLRVLNGQMEEAKNRILN